MTSCLRRLRAAALVAADIVTGVFGLDSIVWFTSLGVHMPRAARADSADVL